MSPSPVNWTAFFSEESSAGVDAEPRPARIGRYRVDRALGRGGFGVVYLGYDEQLNRPVAIKVPHAHRILQPEDRELYLTEARTVAGLDHPNIVPVYDVGADEQFPCYIVSKYIDGADLASRLREGRQPISEAVEIVAAVARALHDAHKTGLVHRDIKPGNILLDHKNRPFVADFGLAVQERDFGKGPRYAGTPGYMSPEQARGEGHRVDGRSDIFSLGVVFYELLVRRRPFQADSVEELLDLINNVEVRPPRQIDDQIPKELERICLRSLAKRASDRYPTASDMADDLECWLETASPATDRPSRGGARPTADPHADTHDLARADTPAPETPRPSVVPKGLRSFDAQDADFFLELLPGPRDRSGLPDSIRFWKSRVEQTDPDEAFSVGLIYGPSGCGKSSLVKAGLLPRLSSDLVAIYVEATADETEMRLLTGLRKRCPGLPAEWGLKEVVAALRRGGEFSAGKKVLIVLDQFEQWLHTAKEKEGTELLQALRQCDGTRVQCILMVRDDFWLAVSRFMRSLEIDLVPGRNIALVDLFDVDHARKVLAAFGRAFGKLPDRPSETSRDQREFVEQGVLGLTQQDKVVGVRLSLFAEMMKGKPWTPETLKKAGGAERVGIAFLEDAFASPTANPVHRMHQQAARMLLAALLPESGADIRGHMRSRDVLLAASGYADRPRDFAELLRILDSELRLITPTDPEGIDEGQGTGDKGLGARVRVGSRESGVGDAIIGMRENSEQSPDTRPPTPDPRPPAAAPRYYQLTHDYLVPALRDWLTRKQRETRRGRAELLLAEGTAIWNAKPESRNLPSLSEFARIYLLTDRRKWSDPQRRMMAKAGRMHGARSVVTAALVVMAAIVGVSILDTAVERKRDRTDRAKALVESLASSDTAQVMNSLAALKEFPNESKPLLEGRFNHLEEGSPERLFAAMALLPDESKADYLLKRLLILPPEQFAAVCDALVAENLDRVVALARAELQSSAAPRASDEERELVARRQALAALALVRCGISDAMWPLLRQTAEPRVRSCLIHWAGPHGANPQLIMEYWEQGPDVDVRRSLLLMLGEFVGRQFMVRESMIIDLLKTFENDPDSGHHSAAEWLLGRWRQGDRVQAARDRLRAQGPVVPQGTTGERKWFVNSEGQTFAIIDAGDFEMGSPESEPGRGRDEPLHHVHIGRRVAIAATHVTRAQYGAFLRDAHIASGADDADKIPGADDSPQTAVTWYEAARYCNWLSKQEALPECYEPNDNGDYAAGLKTKENYLQLNGYRLPTEAEWEFACRAGTKTSRYFGSSEMLLSHYAWYAANAQDRLRPVASLKPNDLGLFDMLGNACQWCGDEQKSYPEQPGRTVEDSGTTKAVVDSENRVVRGGSFDDSARHLRSAYRDGYQPGSRLKFVGFRPVRTLP